MSTEPVKKTRRQRRNYKTVVDRLVQYCELSIAVLEPLSVHAEDVATTPPSVSYYSGQIATLKAVLSQVESK